MPRSNKRTPHAKNAAPSELSSVRYRGRARPVLLDAAAGARRSRHSGGDGVPTTAHGGPRLSQRPRPASDDVPFVNRIPIAAPQGATSPGRHGRGPARRPLTWRSVRKFVQPTGGARYDGKKSRGAFFFLQSNDAAHAPMRMYRKPPIAPGKEPLYRQDSLIRHR